MYSQGVEEIPGGLDGVAACAVVGTPDDKWGEAVRAVVVPTQGATLTLEAVQDVVKPSLAGSEVPCRVVLVTELPVLASGKVDKKRLRADLQLG